MRKNYIILFLMFFAASILGGFALKDIVDYSTAAGYGLGTIFLICSIFFAVKNQNSKKAQ